MINLGLLYNKTRSSSGSAPLADKHSTIGSRMRDLISQAPDFCRESLAKSFLVKNKSTLLRANLPWFLPEKIGGLGLVGTPCHDDILYAHWALRNLARFEDSKRPSSLSEPAKWQARLLANRTIRRYNPPIRQLTDSEAKLSEETVTILSVAQFMDPTVQADPNLIYRDATISGSTATQIRKNEKIVGQFKRLALKSHKIHQGNLEEKKKEDPELFNTSVTDEEYLIGSWKEVKQKVDDIVFPSRSYALFLRNSVDLFDPNNNSWAGDRSVHERSRFSSVLEKYRRAPNRARDNFFLEQGRNHFTAFLNPE